MVAVLPSTLADEVYLKSVDAHFQHPFRRLRAMYDMPLDVFREENATVRVTVALFDLEFQADTAPRQRVTDLSAEVEVPSLAGGVRREPRLKHLESDKSGPAITTPVSGDPAVRVCHDGRWVKLKFQCGLTEAMVLNAIYRDRIAAHRPHANIATHLE